MSTPQLPQQRDADPVQPQREPQAPDACHIAVRVSHEGRVAYGRCETHGVFVGFAFSAAGVHSLLARRFCPDGR